MNTSQFMDKQIMDLSNSQSSSDFLDPMNHHQEENHHHAGGGVGGGSKKEQILSNYDFQSIRPLGTSSPPQRQRQQQQQQNHQVYNYDSSNFGGKGATNSTISKYGSVDTVEPVKVISEKDHNIYDAALLSEIDRTMKKHADNLLYALEGVSARLTQMETRSRHLENSVDDLKVSVGNNYGSTDGKMRQIENILREVQADVQVVKDKQEILEAQMQLSKLQVSMTQKKSESQTTEQMESTPVQQVASAPMESHHQFPPQTHTQQPPNFPPPPPPPTQYPPNQIPSMPQHDPYYLPPGQSQSQSQSQTPDTTNQHYQGPPPQQILPPLQSQPQSQQPPQYHPPPPPPQYSQHPSPPQQNPSQPQPPVGHHSEEPHYMMPSQSYPPIIRQSSGGPPIQQFYGGAPPMMYDQQLPPPSSRPSSGFSYGSTGNSESFSYVGPQSQYNVGSPRKSNHISPPSMGPSRGNGYSQLPKARILPQALPTASAVGGGGPGSGSGGSGNRVPIDDVVDKVTSMGFSREQVRASVKKLTENGQSVDLNIVLDKLMNDGVEAGPTRGRLGR